MTHVLPVDSSPQSPNIHVGSTPTLQTLPCREAPNRATLIACLHLKAVKGHVKIGRTVYFCAHSRHDDTVTDHRLRGCQRQGGVPALSQMCLVLSASIASLDFVLSPILHLHITPLLHQLLSLSRYPPRLHYRSRRSISSAHSTLQISQASKHHTMSFLTPEEIEGLIAAGILLGPPKDGILKVSGAFLSGRPVSPAVTSNSIIKSSRDMDRIHKSRRKRKRPSKVPFRAKPSPLSSMMTSSKPEQTTSTNDDSPSQKPPGKSCNALTVTPATSSPFADDGLSGVCMGLRSDHDGQRGGKEAGSA